ncbi:MAG: hypothetical protein Q4B28_02210 [bacterium]|nr:hypothetical protein [bacterium]
MTKTANHHTPDLNQENSMSHIPQNSLQEKLAPNAKLGLSKALAGVALAGSVGVPAQAVASE